MAQIFRIQYQDPKVRTTVKVDSTDRQRAEVVARTLEAQGHRVQVDTIWA